MSKRTLDIVTCMSSPQLFEPWFRGPSWDGWKSVLRAAFALPMSEQDVAFFREVAGGREPPRKRVRELWVCVGRGGGKDSMASAIVAHAAALFDGGSHLRPGERALVACLAVDREQAKIVMDYSRSYFHDIPALKKLIVRETQYGFELSNRVDVSVTTNNYRSIRGRSMLCVVFDECAFWRDETTATPDIELYRAVGPGLARVPNSMLVGISSPYRRDGLLYKKYDRFFGKDDDDILVIQAESLKLNPTLDRKRIERDLQEDYAAARAEWFGEFRDDLAGWLPLETIQAAVDNEVVVRPPIPSANGKHVRYFAGVDPSGGAKDSYTCAVAHMEGNIAVLDCVHEIKAPFNPTQATEQITGVIKSYGLHVAHGDAYSKNWVVDAFNRCGVRYIHSERNRSEIYLDALPLFTSGRVRLIDSPRLITQFARLERKTSALGKDRVDHGRGGNDDACNAAALALVLAATAKPSMCVSDSLLEIGRREAFENAARGAYPW